MYYFLSLILLLNDKHLQHYKNHFMMKMAPGTNWEGLIRTEFDKESWWVANAPPQVLTGVNKSVSNEDDWYVKNLSNNITHVSFNRITLR